MPRVACKMGRWMDGSLVGWWITRQAISVGVPVRVPLCQDRASGRSSKFPSSPKDHRRLFPLARREEAFIFALFLFVPLYLFFGFHFLLRFFDLHPSSLLLFLVPPPFILVFFLSFFFLFLLPHFLLLFLLSSSFFLVFPPLLLPLSASSFCIPPSSPSPLP